MHGDHGSGEHLGLPRAADVDPGLQAPQMHSSANERIHVLGENVEYQELGADYFDRRLSDDRRARRAVNELHRLVCRAGNP